MELKPHFDWDSQLLRLRQRGLFIDDESSALEALMHHNYYRLRGYFHVFLSDEKSLSGVELFKPQTRMDDLIAIMDFDFKLRSLLFEVIAQFELSLRTSFAYHGGLISPEIHITGVGLTDEFKSLDYVGKQDHNSWLEGYKQRVGRMRSENFVSWHFEKYSGRLPIWVAVETMDFGSLSKLFRSSSQKLAHSIANEYGCTPTLLKSWVASINDLRNSVAHLNRLWNAVFVIAPKTNREQISANLSHLNTQSDYERHKIYSRLAILVWLENGDRFNVRFKERLLDLLASFPSHQSLSLTQMGFPNSWESLDLWKTK
jgi:abortive infection bacteriophage resistance protein